MHPLFPSRVQRDVPPLIVRWLQEADAALADPAAALSGVAASMARSRLVACAERDAGAVWVTEDRAPNGTAGYYERVTEPAPHQLRVQGRRASFWIDDGHEFYEIRSAEEATPQGNAQRIAFLFHAMALFVDLGLCTWPEVLALAAQRARAETPWWSILRVPPDATREEIDAGYKRAAAKAHPDVGGTNEAFVAVRRAYEHGKKRAPP